MRFDLWKRWQWAIVGVLLGLGVAAVWAGAPDFGVGDGRESFTDVGGREFRRQLRRVVAGTPVMTDITVYPRTTIVGAKVVDPVTFTLTYLRGRNEGATNYFYYADVPFEGSGENSYPDVRTFLGEVAGKGRYDHVTYTYAWWRQPKTAYLMGALGGLLLMGGVWPTVLRLAARAGGLPPAVEKESGYGDLGGRGAEPAPAAPAASVEDDEEIDAVMAHYVNAGAPQSEDEAESAEEDAEAERRLRDLETAPLAPAASAARDAAERKEYGGDYYPVARSAAKREDKPKE